MGSGDHATMLLCEQWLLCATASKVGTRSVSENHTSPWKGSGRFQHWNDKVDFLTGWEEEERQTPLKEEIKTPVRSVKSLIVPRSHHLLVWVDLYTGKKEGQPSFLESKHNLDFQGFSFQKAVWVLRQTPTNDSDSHSETSHGCLALSQ